MILQCPIGHLVEHEKVRVEFSKIGNLSVTVTCEECNRIYTMAFVGQIMEMEIKGSKDKG
jgi:RNase P subunit RPR2